MDKKTLTIVFAICLAVFITLTCVWSSKTKETTTTDTTAPSTGSSFLNIETVADTSTEQSLKDKNAENVTKFADKIQKEPLLFTLMCIFGIVAVVSGAMLVAPKFVKKSW